MRSTLEKNLNKYFPNRDSSLRFDISYFTNECSTSYFGKSCEYCFGESMCKDWRIGRKDYNFKMKLIGFIDNQIGELLSEFIIDGKVFNYDEEYEQINFREVNKYFCEKIENIFTDEKGREEFVAKLFPDFEKKEDNPLHSKNMLNQIRYDNNQRTLEYYSSGQSMIDAMEMKRKR